MALFDKMLGKDDKEKKLKQEINSLELRKESVLSAINNEITRLQRERSNVLLQAGTAAYDVWSNNGAQADLTEFWNKIQELEKAVAEQEVKKEEMVAKQEVKKEEMVAKYDEEIRLINSNLGISSVSFSLQCPKCGAPVGQGDRFCQNCGASI